MSLPTCDCNKGLPTQQQLANIYCALYTLSGGSTGVSNFTNIVVSGNAWFQGTVEDGSGSVGTAGQIFTSTGTGTAWSSVYTKMVAGVSTTTEHTLTANFSAVGFTTANVLALRHTDAVNGCSAVRFLDPSTGNEYGAVGVAASGFAGGIFHATYLEGSDVIGNASGLPIRIIQTSTLTGSKAYASAIRMEVAVTAGGPITFKSSTGATNICQLTDGYFTVGTTTGTGQIQVCADSGFTTGGIRFLNGTTGLPDGMLAQAADNNIYLLMAAAGGNGAQFNVIRQGDFASCFKVNSLGNLVQLGDTFNQATQKTPASAAAAGTAGDICHDANFIYVCTANNTWKRVAIATW